ncbi:MAG: PAS domain-containing sensor histidine kinase [Candidatus Kaelpia imicola]|nr:PAS domain-containing sensor histidine kinase [Candidatus Kaelpia imicola]
MTEDLKKTTISAKRLNEEIAERKKMEVNLQQATEEWERTFNAISDLVFIQDKDFIITKVNKAFVDVLKMKPEDIIGKKCYQIFHHRDTPWSGCLFKKTQESKAVHTEEVDDFITGIPLSVTISPVFDESGNVIASVHIARDISECKQAERIKDEFISTVSHELRTPLSIIKEGVSLVLDQIPGKINKEQDDILKTAKENINRLAKIINGLLDISKIEAKKVELEKKEVEISVLLSKISSIFKNSAREREINLEVKSFQEDVKLYIDEDKIIQVFTNLIDNALKFTEKGKVEIAIYDIGKDVECSVSDTGRGISKEDLPKLFDKFQQFGRTPGPGAKGTGLGLSISKGIVEIHGGRVWVESKLGKGTKFIFTLPKIAVK